MLKALLNVFSLLDAQYRRKARLLFVLMLAMGAMEVVGIASIMPFIAVVSDPAVIQTTGVLKRLYEGLGFSGTNSFLLALGAAVCVIVLANLALKLMTQRSIHHFAQLCSYSLSSKLFHRYLQRPYTFFLDRHSADLGKAVLSEVNHVVAGALLPSLQLVANGILGTCLIALLVAAEPFVGLSALTFFGLCYAGVYWGFRKHLRKLGALRQQALRAKYRVAQESLAGIKDVKVLRLEEPCLRSYEEPALRFAQAVVRKQIASQTPSYVMQGLTFVGMMSILLMLLHTRSSSISDVLPTIVLFTLAGTRIQAAFNQAYQSLAALRFAKPTVDTLYSDMMEPVPHSNVSRADIEPLPLVDCISLEGISYTYAGVDRPSLVDVSLTIPAGATVGFVGATGSGKTTAVDLILGLLESDRGRLLVDGVALDRDNVREWQANIGYVSQHIFLKDDSIAANIAFGVTAQEMDMEAVIRAAKTACLHDFVTAELPDGYRTKVGDRGTRLSGGQRQRIGIARALYHDPQVLVLDEATSALDSITEQAVIDAVEALAGKKTILMVTHRISTVRTCDRIFVMDGGRLVGCGSFAELMESEGQFKALAAVAQ